MTQKWLHRADNVTVAYIFKMARGMPGVGGAAVTRADTPTKLAWE